MQATAEPRSYNEKPTRMRNQFPISSALNLRGLSDMAKKEDICTVPVTLLPAREMSHETVMKRGSVMRSFLYKEELFTGIPA